MTVEILDYEARDTFELTMIAVDDGNLLAEVAVIIRISNVNEAPVAETVIQDRTLVESDGVNQFDVSAYFNDPDGDAMIYTASSSDSDVARVGLTGATLALTPIGIGTATVEVTAADPDGLSIEQGFIAVNVVDCPRRFRGFLSDLSVAAARNPAIPPTTEIDHANLLSENLSHRSTSHRFSRAGPDGHPANDSVQLRWRSATRQCCWRWSARGQVTAGVRSRRTGRKPPASTTFTAPDEGERNDHRQGYAGKGRGHGNRHSLKLPFRQRTRPPESWKRRFQKYRSPAESRARPYPAAEGASITSPNGLTMYVPPDAIYDDYLGAYIEELSPSDIVVPEGSMFTVGIHAGNFSIHRPRGRPNTGFSHERTGTHLPTNHAGRPRYGRRRNRRDPCCAPGRGMVSFIHHPADNDVSNMTTCANRRSIFALLCRPYDRATYAYAYALSHRQPNPNPNRNGIADPNTSA